MIQHSKNIVSRCFSPLLLRFAFFVSLLFLSACPGPVQNQPPRDMAPDIYISIDAPVETVGEPYQPIDDGKPLSAQELHAFESTGELDTALSMEEKQIVELYFKSFVHNNRKTVERFLKRSELYMPFVVKVFRERGMPEELSCLAFVESGFNPNAVSRAGAGGMWQFMPFTGRKFGLSQDRWLDERRDPYKSTVAAAAYLSKLYEMFNNDWHLAISAYNAGEGKIGRALAGTDSKTFFEIVRKNAMLEGKAQLKEETRQYLPRFLAFTKIMRNLELLGFPLPDRKNALEVEEVTLPAGVDLRRFARDIKMDWEQFSGFNPAYLRAISSPSTTTRAYVPAARKAEALAALQQKDIALYAGWRDYRVRSGDSMGRIAARSGTSTALLRQVNNRPNNILRVGDYLLIPGSAGAARSTMARMNIAPAPPAQIARNKEGTPATGYRDTHNIVSGDTLYNLASRWGTSVDDICRLNAIEPSERLKIGRTLYIPAEKNLAAAGPAEHTPEARPALRSRQKEPAMKSLLAHLDKTTKAVSPKQGGKTPAKTANSVVIKQGDTFYSLARAHGTSVDAIAKLNGINPKAPLKLGQVLRMP
ncbi:lytic transglycosylase [Deltaproteobacteria bacterium]|nr:lytic transglycosylase [Deltaproteobacteria bacterium]